MRTHELLQGITGGVRAAKAGHDVIMTPASHCYLDYRQSLRYLRTLYKLLEVQAAYLDLLRPAHIVLLSIKKLILSKELSGLHSQQC